MEMEMTYTAMQKDIKLIRLEDGSGIEFEATLDGVVVGYYDTRIEAEEALDAAAYRRLQQQPVAEEAAGTMYNPERDDLEAAYEQASRHDMPPRWRRALERGYALLISSGPIVVQYGPMGDIAHAHIPSQSEAGKTHNVNRHCDCEAGQYGNPCAHRAAKRLLNIAHEQEAARLKHPTPAPALTRENAFPAWATRKRPDLFKDED
jgi:hypothetical protein